MNKTRSIESNEVLKLPKEHISVIGDLDGSYQNFIARIKEQGLISKDLKTYTGGSRKVVFSGDIIADVEDEGFKILQFISFLKKEAQKKGGNISVLAGNHEEFMIGYLLGDSVNLGNVEISEALQLMQSGRKNKANGLNELYSFGKNRNEILENMNKDKFGKMILEEICQFKLVDISGDTLFFHTPPTEGMLKSLQGKDINNAIKDINNQWQNILRTLLLGNNKQSIFAKKALKILGQNTQEEQLKGEYKILADTFLNTANDTPNSILIRLDGNRSLLNQYQQYFVYDDPIIYDFLYQQGITTIVYGHTNSQLRDHKIKFIDVNQRSVELNKPDNNTFTPLNPIVVEKIKENNIKQLSEVFSKINTDWIYNDFIESYNDFLNAGYRTRYPMKNEIEQEFINNPYLQDLLKELTKDILKIKEYDGKLCLRIGLEYFETDFGTRTRFSKDIPKNISDFIEKIIVYIISQGIKTKYK